MVDKITIDNLLRHADAFRRWLNATTVEDRIVISRELDAIWRQTNSHRGRLNSAAQFIARSYKKLR